MRPYSIEQQERLTVQIQEDLSGQLAGQVATDLGTRSAYATDASLHEVMPLAVAFPKTTEDVVAIVRYAGDNQIPVTPRGSGTGLAGGCLGRGIIIDFRQHMNQILEVGEKTVKVQPGVVLNDLNNRLREQGRYFAPDPSNASITTIGGMIGVDAAGSHAVGVGSTRDHIRSMVIALSDGSLHTIQDSTQIVAPGNTDSSVDSFSRMQVILRRLAALLQENEELIEQQQPFLVRNCAGYELRRIINEDRVALTRLMVGSEGTLGICTSAELYTLPLPQHRRCCLLVFQRFDEAVSSVSKILSFEPTACDLLDRRLLMLARESSPKYSEIIPQHAAAALIVAFENPTEQAAEQRSRRFEQFVDDELNQSRIVIWAKTEAEMEELWQLPRQVVPLLARIHGEARPIPFIEDIVVPPDQLRNFMLEAQKTFQRYQVTATLYAHAGSGQLHFRPFLEVPNSENTAMYESLARDLYRSVGEAGGSISGEHGDGISRTPFLRTQYGALYRVFQQVKQLFDPLGILNPDKVVSGDPHLSVNYFRPSLKESDEGEDQTRQLSWTGTPLPQVIQDCNGCGQCKTNQPHLRMCPFHRINGHELASPRAKVNALRKYLSPPEEGSPATPEERLYQLSPDEMLDSCFNCKQCQLECPSNVDIPHLWLEAKAAHVLQHGISRTDWYLSRAHRFAEFSWRFAWLVNRAMGSRSGRWLLESLVGIDSRRKLPPLTSKPYLQQVSRRKRKRGQGDLDTQQDHQKPVVLFIDHYANYHDPGIPLALEAILRHHNIPYLVPEEQTVSGMGLISVGDLAAARELAEENLRVLGTYANEKHPIVCLDPATTICLKQDYPFLMDHPDAKAVADQCVDAGEFLFGLVRKDLFELNLKPVSYQAAYHEPCRQRALGKTNHYLMLLDLIPELTIDVLDKGCSGMAGHFGFTKRNYDLSIQIGSELIDAYKGGNHSIGLSECAACRQQLQHGSDRAVAHPLKLIAASLGVMDLPKGFS